MEFRFFTPLRFVQNDMGCIAYGMMDCNRK